MIYLDVYGRVTSSVVTRVRLQLLINCLCVTFIYYNCKSSLPSIREECHYKR